MYYVLCSTFGRNSPDIRDRRAGFHKLLDIVDLFVIFTNYRQNTAVAGLRGDLKMPSTLVSRNIIVSGHRTSMRLERAMWDALFDVCRRERNTIHAICTQVDETRQESSLTAALRVFIMNVTGEKGDPEDEHVFINPEITSRKGSVEGEEGCLSLPGTGVPIWAD